MSLKMADKTIIIEFVCTFGEPEHMCMHKCSVYIRLDDIY